MSHSRHDRHASPDGLLPAQFGIVLVRRPTLGHVAATLVSLAERGMVTVTSAVAGEAAQADDAAEWLLARSRRPRDPARFESVLLDGLPPASRPLPLTEDAAEGIAPALRAFAGELVKDAVHHGWLRRLHHDQLTPDGEELAARARELRAKLRHDCHAGGKHELPAGQLACAVVFGLVPAGSDLAAALPLARFAAAFVSACSGLPDWQRPESKHEFPDVDTWSRNEWGGMPPGTHGGGF